MFQEVFRIPYFNIPIYGYGLMMVLGFLGALQLARFLAKRSGIDPEIFVNAAIIALITGVAGARLSHVLENLSVYTNPARSAWENLKDAINIRSGGLTFYGGFLLAFPCTVAYGLYKKVPIRRGMDIVAPCLMIGLGVGRIGCFLNGCCEGAECNLPAPFGVQFPYGTNPYQRQLAEADPKKQLDPSLMPPPGALRTYVDKTTGRTMPLNPPSALTKQEIAEAYAGDPVERDQLLAKVEPLHSRTVHPAQLYSTLTAGLIAVFLVAYYSLPHAPGRVFALMLMVEAPSRFLLEMLRAEPAFVGHGTSRLSFLPPMSFSEFLSVWLFLLGVVLWVAFKGPPDDLGQPGVADAETPRGAQPAV
jgi:phosphatidylglycerol---prolipoprotein diacylglyceryl transferase